jgi:hypothetical protein
MQTTFNGDPVIKVGDTISYYAGFYYRQNTTFNITGISNLTTFLIVDG